MDLNLSEDQQRVRDAFGEIFAKESSLSRVRAAEPEGFDEALWKVLAGAGVPLMAVAEDRGGGGAGLAELVVALREAGRFLASAPVVESAVAARLLDRYDAGRDVLSDVVTGDVLPTVALRPAVRGTARLVPAGAVADVVLLLDGPDLLMLRRHGDRPYSGVPANLGCSPISDVLTDAAWERTVLASGTAAAAAHEIARTEWKLLTAALLDGLRAEALRIGVEYVKERRAFGVPLGWFQSIAHRFADLATAGEGGELLVHEAAWALDQGRPDGPGLAAMAFLHTADAAFRTCRASLQFHGGYGYTLEYDIQLYFRRAKAWPLALGAPREEYRALARTIFSRDGDR